MSSDFIPEFDREVPTGEAVPITAPPERKRLESGIVLAAASELTPGLSSQQQLYQVAATFKVIAPEEFAGALIWENFVIGDQEDPTAEQAATWGRTIGGSRFRRYADRAKVPFGKMSSMVAGLMGRPVVIDVYTRVEPAKKQNRSTKEWETNPYAGKSRRNIRDFYAVGEKPLAAKGSDFTSSGESGSQATVAEDPTATITCPVPTCGQTMPSAEFTAHVNAH